MVVHSHNLSTRTEGKASLHYSETIPLGTSSQLAMTAAICNLSTWEKKVSGLPGQRQQDVQNQAGLQILLQASQVYVVRSCLKTGMLRSKALYMVSRHCANLPHYELNTRPTTYYQGNLISHLIISLLWRMNLRLCA